MSFLGQWFGSGPKMCRNCGAKPVFQNHEYCGKTCADWAKNNPPAPRGNNWGPPPGPSGGPPGPAPGWGYGNYGPPPPQQPQQQGGWSQYGQYQQGPQQAPGGQMCQNCRIKPVFPGHQYCSKTCGTSAKQGAPPPMPAQPPPGPPQGFNGYPPQQGPWPPQGPPGPQQGWGPQGGQWPPQQGGPPWGSPPQQGWNPGGPPMPGGWGGGGYGPDDDDDDEGDWDDEPDFSAAKRGDKRCMNCFRNPSYGNEEFCSKQCKQEAKAKLGGRAPRGRGRGRGRARAGW